MSARSLALAGMVLTGCSTVSARHEAGGPVGCCCTFGNCRADLTRDNCAEEGQFQGWAFTWHPGACTSDDTHPAPDYPPAKRQ
jgi:hypothetical protein